MDWSEEIVGRLREFKRDGLSFNEAWSRALYAVPPRGAANRGELTLLKPAGELDLVEFTRLACDDAWHGRRPALAGLTLEALDDARRAPASRVQRTHAAPLSQNVG